MNHVILAMVMILETVPLLLVLMWWPKTRPQLSIDQVVELKMKIIEGMVPTAVCLWQNLLRAIQDNKPKGEIDAIVKELSEYLQLMGKV